MGWSPEVTWSTPIPQIVLAVEGKMDFTQKTNPFGAPPRKPTKKRKKPRKSPEELMASLALIKIDARQKHIERHNQEADKCQKPQNDYS